MPFLIAAVGWNAYYNGRDPKDGDHNMGLELHEDVLEKLSDPFSERLLSLN